MSEIRELLAAAQQAEIEGDLPEAVRRLRLAEAWYRERGLAPRAEQMLRQVRRLGGAAGPAPGGEDFGFGAELEPAPPVPARPAPAPGAALAAEGRPLLLVEAGVEAWCSFCCRPSREVGPLAAGPTHAYVCRGCAAAALVLVDR